MKLEAFDKTPAATLGTRYSPVANTKGVRAGGEYSMDVHALNVKEQAAMGLHNFGEAQKNEALALLTRYRKGKHALEERIKDENLWWRRRHFEMFKSDVDGKKRVPAGAQLFNAIENKIADIYDNIPDCSFLARSQDDEATADMLTDVMPALLEQNDLEKVFMAVTREKVTGGTGIYAVTWDQSKMNGLGDVHLRSVSPLNLYWEPGLTDIQESPGLFFVDFVPNEVLESQYPQLEGKLGHGGILVEEKYSEDDADDSYRTPVIDYYYKRKNGTRTILHYAKICSDVILYASENDPECAERGWYDHGRYPFETDVLFPMPGSPCGFGYVTVGKDQQYQIDKLNNAIVRNAIVAATRRKYVSMDAQVNEEELMDIEREVVRVGSNRNINESVMTIDEPALSGNYISILQNLEETMKEVTSNRDFSNGGTMGGVTSGTAISALVEAGNKQSRMVIRGSYEAYKRVVTLCFELYRQFGDTERFVRIKGSDGTTQYTTFSNASIKAVPQVVAGTEIGEKEPVFHIMVRPHKKSPFARVTQNQMMQEFYAAGFFAPENATPALACLEGMEFDGKDTLCRKIEQNGTLYTENIQLKQAMLRLAAIVDMEKGTNMTAEMAASFGVDVPAQAASGGMQASMEPVPDAAQAQTDPRMQKAAAGVAESTSV